MKTAMTLGRIAMAAGVASAGLQPAGAASWVTRGFDDFSRGTFDSAGANLYVSRAGRLQMIRVWDVNRDGEIDLFFGQSHDLVEYQPALVYFQRNGAPGPDAVRSLPTLHAVALCLSDLNRDGFTDAVVLNDMWVPEPAVRSYIYWGGPGGPSPKYRTTVPTFSAFAVFAADLNADGLEELVVLNRERPRFDLAGGCISIHWQTAAGVFPADRRDDIAVPSFGAADMADVNGDGRADLVFCGRPAAGDLSPAAVPALKAMGSSAESDNVFLLAGRDGGFEPMAPLALRGRRTGTPRLLSLDGGAHLAMVCPEAVDLYRFQGLDVGPPVTLNLPGARHLAAADFDADGRDDLACAFEDRVAVFRGSPSGFDPNPALTLAVRASCLAAGDLTSDGRPDLAVGVHREGTLYAAFSRVYVNDGGAFPEGRMVRLATSGATAAYVADLDADGRNDVAFVCGMGGDASLATPVRVYLGSPDGAYRAGRHLDLPAVSALSGFMADFSDDGFTDLFVCNQYEGMAVTNQTSPIYLGGADGLSTDRAWQVPTEHAYLSAVADINRDGFLDIAVAGVEDGISAVHWGGADGYSARRRQPIPLGAGYAIHLADLDRDGWLDLVYAAPGRDATLILAGGPDGFDPQPRMALPMPLGGSGVESADLDGDGWLDLVVTGWSSPRKGFAATNVPSLIWWGSPEGFSAARRTEFLLRGADHDVAIADLDRDGWLDLVCSNYDQGIDRVFPAYIYWGNAAAAYGAQSMTRLLQAASLGVAVADMNHDGWLDVCFANHNPGGDHRTLSRVHWNRQGRFNDGDATELPTVGAHYMIPADLGNAYTRRLEEAYTSAAFERPAEGRFRTISWSAEEPFETSVAFEVRAAATEPELASAAWTGPDGAGSLFAASGGSLETLPAGHRWFQYRATLATPNGAATPIVTEVRVDY